MAEFGAQATQLTAPQGAGSAPLAPVQEQAVNTSMMPLLAGAAHSIGQGISNIMAGRAEAQRDQIQKDHAQGIQKYNDMLEAGEIKLNEYSARVRLHNDQYGSVFPNMSKEFKANIEMANMGRSGPAMDQVKTSEEIATQRIKDMNKKGIDISFNDSPEVRKAAEAKYNEMLRMDMYNEMITKEAAAFTAKTNIEKERMALDAHEKISSYAATETDYVYKLAEDIGRKVRSGAVSYDEGKLRIDKIMTQIDLSLNEMASVNKDSADRFRKTFDQTGKNVYAMIDPKVDLDMQKVQNDRAIEAARGRALVRDPRLADTLFQLETMKGAPDIVRNKFATSGGLESFIKMFNTKPEEAGTTAITPVVGTRDDAAVTQNTKNLLRASKGNAELTTQAFNATNNYLSQVGNGAAGRDPEKLQEAGRFLASDEFGDFMASQDKNLSMPALKSSKDVIKRDYENAMVGVVEQSLVKAEETAMRFPNIAVKKSLTDPADYKLQASTATPPIATEFSDGRVRFVLNFTPMTTTEARDAQDLLESLKKSEDAVNRINRINTHVSRSKDYKADWEENKYNYLPRMYKFKPGEKAVHNNVEFEYVGKGEPYDYRKPTSWKPTGN